MPLPFRSLRANLIAAFAIVIAVSLLLASAAFAYIVRDYQTAREKQHIEDLALPVSATVTRMVQNGQTGQAIAARMDETASEANVRILLVTDFGLVVHDTDSDKLAGGRIGLPPAPTGRALFEGTLPTEGEPLWGVVSYRTPGLRVALVQPEQAIYDTWSELKGSLMLASGARGRPRRVRPRPACSRRPRRSGCARCCRAASRAAR